MLTSDLCDYNDVHIVVKGSISVTGTNKANRRNKKLTLKNNAPFKSCITKINNKFVDHAKDLNVTILMYNLLEYSDNYSMTSGSLWNFIETKKMMMRMKLMVMVIKLIITKQQ